MENINSMGSVGLTPAPKQLSQTDRALSLTEGNIKMLMDSISLLEQKLNPVLRALSPKTTGECAKEEDFVAMAEVIRKFGYEINFANSRIKDILERLEI